jgi:hypothetical protein
MIEKQPGVPRINKLRVIHLYEADYNLLLKMLWGRKLIWHGHINNRFNDGQAGLRPGKRCIDVVIHKEMKYLYARLTRTGLATMDNDAKSCYDCIICNLAMMVSKYFGMTDRSCKTHATTLRLMQFRLRTALGESKTYFQHSQEQPVHGSGQGSCASPSLWLAISSILMDCLSNEAIGLSIQDVNKLQIICQWIEGFVDDTALFSSLKPQEDNLNQLVASLKHDAQAWVDLLAATGGKLELSKCIYYILYWDFNAYGEPIPMNISEQRQHVDPITVFDQETKDDIVITRKEVTQSHRTLGAWKTMIGDDSDHLQVITERSNNMACKIASSRLTRHQARVAYFSIYTRGKRQASRGTSARFSTYQLHRSSPGTHRTAMKSSSTDSS